jgi:SNF2 family DNA or RNA helicase
MMEPSPKLDVMEEILEETEGRPIVICALSKQLINLAAARLEKKGIPFGLITGDIHEIDRRKNLDQFQAGRLKALLFTLGAGGEGLTMTAADTIVFLQRSWSCIQNLQAEDRVHRIGSEIHEAIHVIDIVTPGTIEERQIARVHEKLQRMEEIRRDGTLDLLDITDDIRGDLFK